MDPISFSIPNWKNRFVQHQHIEPEFHNTELKLNDIVYGERQYPFYSETFGFGILPITTKLMFVYIGGLIFARKQFIPGYAYFRNVHYNWVGASKYILAGYLIGEIFSSLTFGNPFLLEDLVRTKFRILLDPPLFEHGPLNK